MFSSISGLPLHALAIHAAVVFIPLLVLMSILFVVPRTSRWARWPLALLGLAAPASTLVAKQSGEALQRALGLRGGTNPVALLIRRHSELANQLTVIMLVFGVLAILAALAVGPAAPLAGRIPAGARRLLSIGLPTLLLVAALLAAIWVYRVGDIGSRAVWNPTGSTNYSHGGGS